MVTVTVCVGSSCHLKGAREIIARFNGLLTRHGLTEKVSLKGSFCMERCGEGINWQIEDEPVTSVSESEALDTFWVRILQPLGIDRADASGGAAPP